MPSSAHSITADLPATEGLRTPPQSVEAEQAVLGGLLLDNSTWDQIADRLNDTDFYRHDHQLLFRAIQALIEAEKPCDAVTLAEALDNQQQLEQAGGLEYIGTLARDTPSAANVRAYADIVRERSVMRELIRLGGELAGSAYNPDGRTPGELIENAERQVFEIAERGSRSRRSFSNVRDLLTHAVDRIDTLFHTQSSITGLPTGLSNFDEMTAGLQRGDLVIVAGRPSMGKCLSHDAELVLDDGSLITMADMYRRQDGCIGTLTDDMKIRRTRPGGYLDDGRKPVFEVVTRLGRRVKTTITHPFRTLRGWRRLSELNEGDFIAVPRELPVFGSEAMRDCEIKLLAYFIGDGGLTGTTPMFTTTNSRIQADFAEAVTAFGGLRLSNRESEGKAPSYAAVSDFADVTEARTAFATAADNAIRASGRSARAIAAELGVAPATVTYWRQGINVPDQETLELMAGVLGVEVTCLAGETPAAARRNRPNPLRTWLDELGVYGHGAHTKQVPEPVFRLPRAQLTLFLNRLFATDGWASVYASGQAQIGYATVNEKLARQVQHLLLRFGILAKLRQRWVRYHDARRSSWQLDITHADSLHRFVTEIGIHGKEEALHRVAEVLQNRRLQTNTDLIPVEVWELLEEAKGAWSWAELARRAGVSASNIHAHRRALSRERLARFAMALQSEALLALASSDVYWDRIESITALGHDQVYDLTIPETHNFIANDICVHNTSLAMNIAEHAVIGSKTPVAIFSMEMSGEQLVMRMISSLGRIDQSKLRTGKLDNDDWPRITSAVKLLSDAPLFVDDTPALTPTEIRARARRLKREHGDLGLIVVDYLQLMQIPGTRENRATEISEISRSLKALARELSTPVIALSQLNRNLEQRPNKRPVMSDLRESGSIEQDADLIVFIYRDEVYHEESKDKGTAEIIIGKQRNGPIGMVRSAFLGRFTRFENLAPDSYFPEDQQ